ncbi:hypothetical protein AQJ46_07115 [Streptomyces canus]|uniref:Glycosyltransferase RgtA/B/C/D-like domain-containing protein n=1 Tax=Streptomyces canus TaxID=58343 RepID=A0A101SGM7_9ACTN|nr:MULTISPECIES: hypothetical protein [Streptomyces]KUN73596.1 hypothetical protein AQJ46_07115 [Streptomyces canus]MDI5906543.1 hypothetical protein [Streptomyces sp. 12257]
MTSTLAGDATVTRSRTTGRRSPQWWAAAALPSAVAVVYTALTRGLTGDLHYVLAALRTGRAAGYSPSEVFTHRPYFYRWFVAFLDRLAFFGSTAVREATMNVAGVLLAMAAGYALHAALVRRVGAREAAVTAGATGLVLALAPRNDFLQPEWAAVVLAVFGAAAALGLRRPWPAALLAALPFGLAVMMKYSTAATAAIGVLLVYAVDRGRAVRVAVLGVPAALALFGISVLAGSHEWQWTEDMPQINQSALSRTGIRPHFILDRSLDFLADRAVASPVLLLLPGALLLVLTRVQGRLRRAELLAVAALIGLAAQAVVVVQGNWFLYHGAQMPVVAAVVWGVAVGGARRSPPWCFGAVSLLYGVAPVVYAQLPRGAQRSWEVWAAGLVALLAAVLDVVLEKRLRNRSAVLVALSGVVLLAASIWPGSPHLVQYGKVTVTGAAYLQSQRRAAEDADRIRAELPAGAPVLYLAFGETAYDVGHPARCRYPIATFLQRTRYLPDVAELKSFKENADCVDHDPAPYAVLERPWFQPGRVDPELWRRVTAVYDCPRGEEGERLVLCVRR